MRRLSLQRDYGRLSVVTAPAASPISVDADIKPHLRIAHDGEDTKLTQYAAAAVALLDGPDGQLGRAIMPQTLRYTLDCLPPSEIYLPCPPVTAIKTIVVRDADDNIDTIYDADTAVDTIGLLSDLTAEPAVIWPSDSIGWPSDIKGGTDSMRIDYTAGYADADSVPAEIKQWLLMMVGAMYRDPEGFSTGKLEVVGYFDRMLDNLRVRL